MLEIQELTTLDIGEKLKLLHLGILATQLSGFLEIEKVILNYETMMVYGVDHAKEFFFKPSSTRYHWYLNNAAEG